MKKLLTLVSYILVAAIASGVTFGLMSFGPVGSGTLAEKGASKLDQLSDLIQERFIADVDVTAMEDAAADAMVAALGDEWSYYISAADYDDYKDQMSNSYVGVGITITLAEDGYIDVQQVTAGGTAEAAGILPGDVLVAVDGQDCAVLGISGTRDLVRGEEGTTVTLTIRRGEESLDFEVERAYFETAVATWKMLEGNIGYVEIENFDSRCAQETIEGIEELIAQGANALIFDVRNNPGGYKSELVEVLDYLLPEGPLFRSEYYDGETTVDESDPKHLEMPMVVLVNSESYSAAEFFAAAMSEYDAATVVGEQTYGKGYFQQTYELSDGSAVGLSVGRYFTPNGVSLAGVGVTPEIAVDVDQELFARIYYDQVEPEEDPQVQAAIEALKPEN